MAILDMNGHGTKSPKSHPINVNGHLTILVMNDRTDKYLAKLMIERYLQYCYR